MKVKIGNTIYDAEDEPIMLILTIKDKQNISNMATTATKYCAYPENENPIAIQKWMRDLGEQQNAIYTPRL